MKLSAALPARVRLAANVVRAARLMERPRVIWVSGIYLTGRLPAVRRVAPREAWVRLNRMWFRVAPGQGEMDGFTQAWSARAYEPVDALIAKAGDVVVDGGANVGFYTTLQAMRGARVIAFEPNAATFRRLRAGVERNQLGTAVTTIQAALGSQAGRQPFFVSNVDTIGGTLFANGDRNGISTEVDVVTVDETLATLGLEGVDILKLDVEGAECLALSGARRSLARARAVTLEYHSRELRDCCRAALETIGFQLVKDDGHHLAFCRARA